MGRTLRRRKQEDTDTLSLDSGDNGVDPWIETYTGKELHPFNLQEDQIDILDIAHSLSNICRYNGHCRQHYSVGQHSILVASLLRPHMKAWGLMHDVGESILTDVCKPLKRFMLLEGEIIEDFIGYEQASFSEVEDQILYVVSQKFGLPWPIPAEVKAADLRMLVTEGKTMMHSGGRSWGNLGVLPAPFEVTPWSPEETEEEFLEAAAACLPRGV